MIVRDFSRFSRDSFNADLSNVDGMHSKIKNRLTITIYVLFITSLTN